MLKTVLRKEVRRCTVDKLVALQFLVAILCESRMQFCFKIQQNFLRKWKTSANSCGKTLPRCLSDLCYGSTVYQDIKLTRTW